MGDLEEAKRLLGEALKKCGHYASQDDLAEARIAIKDALSLLENMEEGEAMPRDCPLCQTPLRCVECGWAPINEPPAEDVGCPLSDAMGGEESCEDCPEREPADEVAMTDSCSGDCPPPAEEPEPADLVLEDHLDGRDWRERYPTDEPIQPIQMSRYEITEKGRQAAEEPEKEGKATRTYDANKKEWFCSNCLDTISSGCDECPSCGASMEGE